MSARLLSKKITLAQRKILDERQFIWYASKVGHFCGNVPTVPCSEVRFAEKDLANFIFVTKAFDMGLSVIRMAKGHDQLGTHARADYSIGHDTSLPQRSAGPQL